MKRSITTLTIFNLEKDRQKQYNEDYELMYDACKRTTSEDTLEEMKKLHDLIVENPAKDGYVVLYEVEDDNIHVLVGKYMDKKITKDIK